MAISWDTPDTTQTTPSSGGIAWDNQAPTTSASSKPDWSNNIWAGLANTVLGGASDLGTHLGQAAAGATAQIASKTGLLGGQAEADKINSRFNAGQQNNIFGQPVTPLQNGLGGATQIAGDALKTGGEFAAATLGGGAGATVGARIGNAALNYGLAGAAQGAGGAMSQGQQGADVAKSGLLAGGLSAVGGAAAQGVAEVAPWIAQKTTQLLSKTSNTPEAALQVMNDRPAVVPQIGTSPQEALTNTQGVVRGLRTQLTQSWQNGVQQIADEYKGQTVGLPDKLQTLVDKVDAAYGLDNIPQNTANMSAKELISLQTEVNALARKPALVASPEGVAVRRLADQLGTLGTKTFGGDSGSYATLYQNYSTQKGVLDAANDIVAAYKTGKPIAQKTALARLQSIFDENAPSYLRAMQDLEAATGKDVLSQVSASKITPVAPNIPKIGKSVLNTLFEYLLFPLSSPRMAGAISRGATGLGAGAPVLRTAAGIVGTAASSALGSQSPSNSTQ